MPTKVIIPTALRQYADGKDTVEISATNVREALEQLSAQYPALKKNLYTEDGQLRSFINIYKGDEDIRHLQNLDTALQDGDEIMIVPLSLEAPCLEQWKLKVALNFLMKKSNAMRVILSFLNLA